MARILVIEDEYSEREFLRDLLEGEGHEVVLAGNGRIGIQLHRERPADLVITDIFMPEKDGLETIAELRREFPAVEIIALSGGGSFRGLDVLDLARRLGARHAFLKPLGVRDFLSMIREILAEGQG